MITRWHDPMALDRNTEARISEANKSLTNATWLPLQQQNRTYCRQQVQLHQNTFSPIDAWQQYGIYVVYTGGTVIVLPSLNLVFGYIL